MSCRRSTARTSSLWGCTVEEPYWDPDKHCAVTDGPQHVDRAQADKALPVGTTYTDGGGARLVVPGPRLHRPCRCLRGRHSVSPRAPRTIPAVGLVENNAALAAPKERRHLPAEKRQMSTLPRSRPARRRAASMTRHQQEAPSTARRPSEGSRRRCGISGRCRAPLRAR